MIIDSSTLLHKSKHGMPKTLTLDDVPVEIVYGFMRDLLKIQKMFSPERTIFTWDSKKKDRRKIFPEYKIKRNPATKTDEEKKFDQVCYDQFNVIRRVVVPELGFKNTFIQTGKEADDIIAQIRLDYLHDESVMVTSDHDMFQCLDDNCFMYNLHKEFNKKWFMEEYHGLLPNQWGEVKSISGCTSDDVPGIFRVGEPTAAKYLAGLLNQKTKTYQDITSTWAKDTIVRNRKLVVLPFEGTESVELEQDELKVKDFRRVFNEFNFKSFLKYENWQEWCSAFNLK